MPILPDSDRVARPSGHYRDAAGYVKRNTNQTLRAEPAPFNYRQLDQRWDTEPPPARTQPSGQPWVTHISRSRGTEGESESESEGGSEDDSRHKVNTVVKDYEPSRKGKEKEICGKCGKKKSSRRKISSDKNTKREEARCYSHYEENDNSDDSRAPVEGTMEHAHLGVTSYEGCQPRSLKRRKTKRYEREAVGSKGTRTKGSNGWGDCLGNGFHARNGLPYRSRRMDDVRYLSYDQERDGRRVYSYGMDEWDYDSLGGGRYDLVDDNYGLDDMTFESYEMDETEHLDYLSYGQWRDDVYHDSYRVSGLDYNSYDGVANDLYYCRDDTGER